MLSNPCSKLGAGAIGMSPLSKIRGILTEKHVRIKVSKDRMQIGICLYVYLVYSGI